MGNLTEQISQTTHLISAVSIALILLEPTNALIQLGVNVINQLSEYSKLLLPVMTAAMAAQGNASSSTALYTGTIIFDTILTTVISKIIVPALYLFLCLGIAKAAIDQDLIKRTQKFFKWFITWCLKTILYIFTGYMGITGVVSGSVDAAKLKATKLVISGAVPVVGNILSFVHYR